ncbi:MAG: transcriptional regulator, Crp/Fnr family [Conexibacter sp.]|nr:transcriptional regulator, Crp/Fnr family [Conexibacter sp.]
MAPDLGPFDDLEPETRALVERLAGPPRAYRSGERVVVQGDPASSLHVVQTGHVGVEVLDPITAKSYMITVLGPGALFGELAVLDAGQRRTASVTALDPATVLALSADALRALRTRRPEVDATLVGILTEYVVRLTQQLTTQRFSDADMKVRIALCDLHLAFDRGEIALSQDQLAEVAGVKRQTVSRVLRELEAEGLVTRAAGRITVARFVELLRSVGRV